MYVAPHKFFLDKGVLRIIMGASSGTRNQKRQRQFTRDRGHVTMDPSEVAKQTARFAKVTFDNTFNVMLLVQEQVERTIDIYLDQMLVVPQEGRKVVGEWVNTYKISASELKKELDRKYKDLASFFTDVEKQSKS